MALTQVDQGLLGQYAQYTGFKNRIINGAMMIDQRNAGAAVTVNSTAQFFPVDRWVGRGESGDGVFTVQQSSTAPTTFRNSIVATVTTADAAIGSSQRYEIYQRIEGNNVADLMWGTAAAATVTLSFWVRSSLTGTFGGALINYDADRSYPFSYTISSANTWEQKSITVAGDTSGTWQTNNNIGIWVDFSLGAGASRLGTANAWASGLYTGVTGQTNVIATNGATWYVTGVQLEKGSTATSFDYRPYGIELQLCQRYFWTFIFGDSAGQTPGPVGWGESTTSIVTAVQYPQVMRAAPSISTTNSAIEFRTRNGSGSIACNAVPTGVNINTMACWLFGYVSSGITLNGIYALSGNNSNVKLNFSAEL